MVRGALPLGDRGDVEQGRLNRLRCEGGHDRVHAEHR